jgi:hypothetical protein
VATQARSLSISNSDSETAPAWRRFLLTFAASAAGLLCVLSLFVVTVDPHDHLLFSPPFKRAPINANQRFSYPSIARNHEFDSVVVGTSTARLLMPQKLNVAFGGTFANLSMNSATAYEQARILDLFRRSRAQIQTVLFGVDSIWCARTAAPPQYTPRPFPEWLYDDNPWNDLLHILNGQVLEQSVRQLQFQLGRREPRYGFDGYRTFLPAVTNYDLVRARQKIYGGDGTPRRRALVPGSVSKVDRESQAFGAIRIIRAVVEKLPAATFVVFWFVPYNAHIIPPPGTVAGDWLATCKRRVVELAEAHGNSAVIDMMFPSELTKQDSNYWDSLHFSERVAESLPEVLLASIGGELHPTARLLHISRNP